METKSNFLAGFFENIDFLKVSQNHWKTNGFHWFLEVRPSNKRSKNDAETQLKKTSGKYLCRIDFDLHFNLRKPPKIAPKSTRDAKKRGLGRSLFRDAMEMARKSSQVSGAQNFVTVSLVFHRIRSALSVDLSFVALILKAWFLEAGFHKWFWKLLS